MIDFKPTKGRVLVEPVQGNGTLASGLIIPDKHMDAPTEGVVVSLSRANKTEVKIGDRVVFNRFTGTEVRSGKKTFKILEPNELLAVVEHS